jgi:Flp pilus assembly protein TadD
MQLATEETPDDPQIWSRLAFALNMLSRSEEAVAASERAVLLDPEQASAWASKAASLTNLGRPDEGLATCVA